MNETPSTWAKLEAWHMVDPDGNGETSYCGEDLTGKVRTAEPYADEATCELCFRDREAALHPRSKVAAEVKAEEAKAEAKADREVKASDSGEAKEAPAK